MSKKTAITQREHIRMLVDWMSQGVYEKEQIIAMRRGWGEYVSARPSRNSKEYGGESP